MNEIQKKLLSRLQLLREHGPQWTLVVNILDAIIAKLNTIEKMEGPKGEKGDRGDVGEAIKGDKGERGDVGPQGERGEKGDKGADGRSIQGKQGNVGPQGKRGERGEAGKEGKDGKDGSPDTPVQVREKLSSLKDEERLDASAIKNIPTVTRELPSISLFRQGGSKTLEIPGAGQDIRKILFEGVTVSRVGDGVAKIVASETVSNTNQTTSSVTLTDTSGLITVLCDCTSNNITVNLPTAVGNTARITVKKIDSSANTVIIDGMDAQTVDGGATATLTDQYESVDLVSNNTNFFII